LHTTFCSTYKTVYGRRLQNEQWCVCCVCVSRLVAPVECTLEPVVCTPRPAPPTRQCMAVGCRMNSGVYVVCVSRLVALVEYTLGPVVCTPRPAPPTRQCMAVGCRMDSGVYVLCVSRLVEPVECTLEPAVCTKTYSTYKIVRDGKPAQASANGTFCVGVKRL